MATPKWFDYATYKTNKLAQLQQLDSSWTMTKMEDAFTKAGFTGTDGYFKHFQKYGHTEDVSPNKLFSADYYYKAKALQFYTSEEGGSIAEETVQDKLDYYAQQVKGLINNAGMDAWTHYVKYGTAEGINPSNSFDTAAYMADKLAALQAAEPSAGWTEETMNAAFKKAGLNALSHFMAYAGNGNANEVAEGIAADGTVPDAYVVPESDRIDDDSDATGITFTLTSNEAVLTSSSNVRATPANSYLTTGDDTVHAYNFLDTATVEDKSTTDNDVLDGYTNGFNGSIKNIETVKLTFTADAEFDTTKATGVKEYDVSSNVALTTDFNANINGMTNIDATNADGPKFVLSGAKDLALNVKTLAGKSDVLNVGVNGFTGSTLFIGDKNGDANVLETLNMEAKSAASAFELNLDDDSVKKMVVTGDQDLTLKGGKDVFGGDTPAVEAIDASKHTGNLTLELTGADDTIDLEDYAGVDGIKIDDKATDEVFNASSGLNVEWSDQVTIAATTVSGTDAVVKGKTDALNLFVPDDASTGNAAAQNMGAFTFSGFENLNIQATGTKGLVIADLVTTGNTQAEDVVSITASENVTLTAVGATGVFETLDAGDVAGKLTIDTIASTALETLSVGSKGSDIGATAMIMSNLNTINLGAGADAIKMAATQHTTPTASDWHAVTINDFGAKDSLNYGTLTKVTKVEDLTAADTKSDATIFEALSKEAGGVNVMTWYASDSSTYLFASGSADGAGTEDANDICVKLAGVYDVDKFDLDGGVLTYGE